VHKNSVGVADAVYYGTASDAIEASVFMRVRMGKNTVGVH
jgi:hypothetical protein